MDVIPHIEAHATFVTAVPFTLRACGAHQLVVHAIPMYGTVAPAMSRTVLVVECPPPDLTLTAVQGHAANVGSGQSNGTLHVSGHVLDAGPLDLRAATLGLTSLLRESGVASELVRDGVSSLLPL